MMKLDEVIEIIGGTEAAHDYLQGIVEGSEAARNARRALRAAIQYMKGAGVKYAPCRNCFRSVRLSSWRIGRRRPATRLRARAPM